MTTYHALNIARPIQNYHLGFDRHSFSTQATEPQSPDSLEARTAKLLNYLTINDGSDNQGGITLVHFDQAMEEWSRQGNPESAQRAEELLSVLEQNYDRILSNPQYSTTLVPNAISYNHVLHAYAQSNGGTKAADKCEQILDRMLHRCRLHNENNDGQKFTPAPEPLVTTFNTAMNAWSKSHGLNAGMKAEHIFRKMERWTHDCNNGRGDIHNPSVYQGVQPNTRSLAIVLDAWANSKHDDSFDRILATFYHAVDKLNVDPDDEENNGMNTSRTPVVPLNTVVFNSVLHGLANSSRGREAAEKAQEVFTIMEELKENGTLHMQMYSHRSDSLEEVNTETRPNTRTWSLLLKCWANAVKSTDKDGGESAASQAESILHQMEELYNNGENIKPNAVTYTSCINAWSKCSSETGARHALSILERMEEMYKATKDEELKPNAIHYNSCLSALCQGHSKETLEQAMQLLAKMQTIGMADAASFNTMMNVHLKRNATDAQNQIDSLYQQMQTLNIAPDSITFNTMMDSFSKTNQTDSIEKVTALLDHMIEQSQEDKSVTPTTVSFSIALNAIARSRVDEKAEPARKIFHQLISLHESRNDDINKPDIRSFAAFISACANQSGSDDRKRFALKLALGTFEQLCKKPEYGAPNSFIYGGLLKACGRLTADAKEKGRLLEHIFSKCREGGQVSRVTLDILLKSAPRPVKQKILGDLPGNKIPFEWYRNVKKHERP